MDVTADRSLKKQALLNMAQRWQMYCHPTVFNHISPLHCPAWKGAFSKGKLLWCVIGSVWKGSVQSAESPYPVYWHITAEAAMGLSLYWPEPAVLQQARSLHTGPFSCCYPVSTSQSSDFKSGCCSLWNILKNFLKSFVKIAADVNLNMNAHLSRNWLGELYNHAYSYI